MAASPFPARIYLRLRTKVIALLPLVLGSLVLLAVLSLLLYLIAPLLPDSYQLIVRQMQSGDWAGGRLALIQLLDSFGASKAYAFVALQVLQVLIAPIPGQLLGLLAGYVFGFWKGLLLTMIGLTLGSFIAMGLSRLFGDFFVRKLVPPAILAKFDYLVDAGGLWSFFLLFLLPALPDDAICLIAGLTRLRLWKLLLVCLIGRLPGMAVLAFVGSSAGSNMSLANAVLTIALAIAAVLWLFSDEVEAYFSRLSGVQGPTG